jgi:hypothetical protein
MTDEQIRTGRLKAAELREKIKSGELKFEPTPQTYVTMYKKEVHDLLVVIGKHMSDDPDSWADHCLVTDGSQLGDFFSRDAGDLAIIKEVGGKVGFPVNRQMYIYEVAARMHGVQ